MKGSSPSHEPRSLNRATKHARSETRPALATQRSPTNLPAAPSRQIRLACLTPHPRMLRTLAETLEHQKVPWEFTAYSHLNKILSRMDQSPPNVVLLDFSASARTAFQRTEQLRVACPEARLIGLSDETHFRERLPWIRMVCDGCLLQPLSAATVPRFVERVLADGVGLGPRARARLGDEVSTGPGGWALDRNGRLNVLHELIRAGDPEAPEVLAELVCEPLMRWLARQFPKIDRALIAGAVRDAIMDYLRKPDRFDPGRGTLEAFLHLVAWRNGRDRWRVEKRRTRWEHPTSDEVLARMAALGAGPDKVLEATEAEEQWEQRRGRLWAFVEHLAGVDRRVMELMLSGERRTEVFAQVLGLNNLPTGKQKALVHRAKERLRAAAHRWIGSDT